ncbi:DUF551 domain-containing protein [Citrobacter farmeri]|uniref:DUF551 domain-containing protein n=1 Tax=Citrobacter farmeri TaxID=67824 RepID=UPI00189F042F|nr:DUF551 domain-containing protein [Citrobacter farmeri]
MTTTRFTKEQLLKRLEEQMSSARYALGFVQDSEILRDIEMDLRLAEIALASLTAEPALYAAEETLAYANMGELHLTCLSEPMGDAVIPLYTAPPASVSVPDALPENDDEEGNDIDYMEPSEVYALGRAAGWNACRAAMLQGSQPVSNRDELPVIGWLRSDYNSDDKRDPNAPLFMLGRNDPSETWGVKYIPLTGNSPVIPDGWVACSERMPETDFKVLANVKSTAVEYQCLAEVDENGRWWDEYGEQLPSPFVTHWQPLPAAPQQEAKNV